MTAPTILFATATPATSGEGFVLDNIFLLTIALVLVVAVVGALMRLRRRDKCLQLLDGDPVTCLSRSTKAGWGTLRVASRGLEVVYDEPWRTTTGLVKGSSLYFEDDLADLMGICRTVHALSDEQRTARTRRIAVCCRPGALRRFRRSLDNLLGTIRDAVAGGLTMAVSQAGRGTPVGTVISGQKSRIGELSKSVVGSGNAYEPMLERHIGLPVVLRMTTPEGASRDVMDFAGYLVEYTAKHLAVFNIDHTDVESIVLEVTESTARPGLRVDVAGDSVTVRCDGPVPLVVRCSRSRGVERRLDVVLLDGAVLELHHELGAPMTLELERTSAVDIVCPRGVGVVRHAGE